MPDPVQRDLAERLRELAARCQDADGQNGLLDAEIMVALKSETFFCAQLYMVGTRPMAGAGPDDDWRNANIFFEQKAYTASLDAAMTLVPDGWRLQLSDWDDEILRDHGPWQAILTAPGKRGDFHEPWTRCDHAASAPLALCAAALRARAEGAA